MPAARLRILKGEMTPGTSSLRPLTVLQECHKLLMDSGLKETGEADDDGRESQGQKPAPTLVSLAEEASLPLKVTWYHHGHGRSES